MRKKQVLSFKFQVSGFKFQVSGLGSSGLKALCVRKRLQLFPAGECQGNESAVAAEDWSTYVHHASHISSQ